MPRFTRPRTLTMSGPALPTGPGDVPLLELKGITGEEALSQLYTYTLDCLTTPGLPPDTASNIKLQLIIGQELTVTIQLEGMGAFIPGMPGAAGASNIGAGTREISGIVAHARYVSQTNRQSRYELILKPWLWLADQQSDFRIFQRLSVVQIVERVFDKYIYSYDLRLGDQYPTLDYQVQYGETDYYFVQRMLAEAGIYWFFEHSNTFHRMVLVDHLGPHKATESKAYHRLHYFPPGHKVDAEYIDHFALLNSVQSGRWVTNDYDFKNPYLPLLKNEDMRQHTAHNDFERYEWPGDYTDPEQGQTVARVRMEEVRAHGERAQGSGAIRNVVCGTAFHLEGYPYKAANQEYLVIRSALHAQELAQASGGSDYQFQSTFEVQPATTLYRPPRGPYPKPRTSGPQTARVTGAPGNEIWTDEYGRVKLKFRWDRSEVNDQNSSCWIRVSYPWAGGGFGGVNVPRVNTEVIVDFENGDPDRPIVVGRLYNAATMPPWELPGNATQSGILSQSINGGVGNANAIRFEDKQGQEEVWIQAEKDMRTEVENDEKHSVLHDRNRDVGHDESVTVKHDQRHTTGNNKTVIVDKAFAMAVGTAPEPLTEETEPGTYVLNVKHAILIQCGKSSLYMNEDGLIKLNGVQIEEKATGGFLIVGEEQIDLNP